MSDTLQINPPSPKYVPAADVDQMADRIALGYYDWPTSPFVNGRFQMDLEAVHELRENNKAGKIYNLAWDWGHSYGLSEVMDYYDDLAGLIK